MPAAKPHCEYTSVTQGYHIRCRLHYYASGAKSIPLMMRMRRACDFGQSSPESCSAASDTGPAMQCFICIDRVVLILKWEFEPQSRGSPTPLASCPCWANLGQLPSVNKPAPSCQASDARRSQVQHHGRHAGTSLRASRQRDSI